MPDHAIAAGVTLDLTCDNPAGGLPLDFDRRDKRQRARRLLKDQEPLMLIGSSMSMAVWKSEEPSTHNRDPEKTKRELAKAKLP